MSFTLRLPNITALTPEGQVGQMKGYLYQLAQELEFAINALEVGSVEVAAPPVGKEEKALENFGEVKALIIKSADIVNAYYEKMQERFRGEYVAQSDFGSYRESTEQSITKTDRDISQIFQNVQVLDALVTKLEEKTSNAYIRTGELYRQENGMPVYGLEIGQSDFIDGVNVFRKFARFAADKLSFYDAGGTEVAYVSDSTLFITGARVTHSLIAGSYEVDLTDGMAFKWIGG